MATECKDNSLIDAIAEIEDARRMMAHAVRGGVAVDALLDARPLSRPVDSFIRAMGRHASQALWAEGLRRLLGALCEGVVEAEESLARWADDGGRHA